jgi:hypothetical protein
MRQTLVEVRIVDPMRLSESAEPTRLSFGLLYLEAVHA